MSFNFTFGFNRMVPPSASASWATAPAISRAPAPVSRAPAPVSSAPVSRAPAAAITNVPVTRSNRFSMTRMINFKSSGGCRSCN